jgi:hypothetical protein
MSDKSAADFMRDELEALLASPALRPVAERHTEKGDAPVSQAPVRSRGTERASIDAQALRDALRVGLK